MWRSLIPLLSTVLACGASDHPESTGATSAATTPVAASATVAPTVSATAAATSSSAPSTPSASSSVAPPTSPTSITVVEGTPQALPGGGTISVAKLTYAHLSGSENLSLCEVTVTRNGKSETKTLERRGPIVFVMMAGLRVGLDGTDPYHQPSSAFLVIGP